MIREQSATQHDNFTIQSIVKLDRIAKQHTLETHLQKHQQIGKANAIDYYSS